VGGLSVEDDARSLAQRKLVNSKNPSLNGDSMNQAEDLKPSREWDESSSEEMRTRHKRTSGTKKGVHWKWF
jgi:hypothetical protein